MLIYLQLSRNQLIVFSSWRLQLLLRFELHAVWLQHWRAVLLDLDHADLLAFEVVMRLGRRDLGVAPYCACDLLIRKLDQRNRFSVLVWI